MRISTIATLALITLNLLLIDINLASATAKNKTVRASFFLVKDSEGKPVADQEVITVPCAPINGNCQQVIDILMRSLSGMGAQSTENIKLLDDTIKSEFKKLVGVGMTRTGVDGGVQTECPTANCIVYSSTVSDGKGIFWLKLQRQDTEVKYLPSAGIEVAGTVKSPQMEELTKALKGLQARLSVGVSYTSLSDAVTPYVLALNNARSSPEAPKYRGFLNVCERIAIQMDLLSKAWEAHIKGTQVIYGKTFHLARADFVEPLIELFNDASGYTAITLKKPASGFLATLFGARNIYSTEGLASLMITEIGRKVDWAIGLYKVDGEIGNRIPNINLSSSNGLEDSSGSSNTGSNSSQSIPRQPSPNSALETLDCSIQGGAFVCQ